MDELLKIPHSEIAKELDREKRAKARKKRTKALSSARASRDTTTKG
jgi:hypothetical protein